MAQPFIFGRNTPWSYEDIQRKRRIADELIAANRGAPSNVGEGIAAVGRALAARGIERRAAKRDDELRAESKARRDALMGSIFGGASSPYASAPASGGISGPTPVDPNAPSAIASDAMKAIGKDPASAVRAGLIARGLPAHVADAFVMNLQDESGLNPGINERNPVVPGSRGGFGLAQWTGPRRVALERFAAERGTSVDDMNMQLDFLMTELSGPESAAASAILSAPDTPTAANAILTKFLRPAPENVAKRAAKYGGGAATAMNAQAPANLAAIAEILADPYTPEADKAMLGMLMQQQMNALDPAYQLEMERKRLELAQMQAPAQPPGPPEKLVERQALAAAAGLQPGTPEYASFMATGDLPKAPSPTDDMREYEYAKSQGFTGTFQDYMTAMKKAGAASTVVNNITGEPRTDQALAAVAMDPSTMTGAIDAILNAKGLDRIIGPLEGGGGNDVDQLSTARRAYYGGEGLALIQRVKQLQDTVFLGARQMLKGGGAITDYEGKKAEAAMARLSRVTSEEEFRAALKDLRDAITEGEAKLRAAGVVPSASQSTSPPPPAGAPAGAPAPAAVLRYNPATGELE